MADENIESTQNEKKKCFIITPIGKENDPIRRHINGVIDAAIKPVFESKYDIIVSHKISQSGSINKQIISNVYEDELAIANLTSLNANVMYELAFRHSLKKPVITIMREGEQLPFDVAGDRTIFYKEDFQGLLDLQNELKKRLESMEKYPDKIDNPIYEALNNIETEKIISKQAVEHKDNDIFKYILDRLDKIEDKIDVNARNTNVYGSTINFDDLRGNSNKRSTLDDITKEFENANKKINFSDLPKLDNNIKLQYTKK